MVSNLNENIYVDGVAVDKAALNANLAIAKNEITALQNGSGLESPAAGSAIVTLLNTVIGNTSWQTGGAGVNTVAGIAGPTITTTQLAAAFDTFFGSADWRGPDLSHGGFSNLSSPYNPATDDGQHALVNVTTNAVNILLPDVNSVPNGQPLWVRVNSNNNLASISVAVSGQLRSRNHRSDHNVTADQIFIGYSSQTQEGAWAKIWRRSGVGQVAGLITATADINDNGRYGTNNIENGNFTLEQADEREMKIWTGGTICTVPFLLPGSQFVIKRDAGSDGTFQRSGTTQFNFEGTLSTFHPITDGKTVTLIMRANSNVIDVLGGA